MRVGRLLLLLPLLVAAKAFPQKVVHEHYNRIMNDTCSSFYNYEDFEYLSERKYPFARYAFPFDRVTTSEGDTLICFAVVGVQNNRHKMIYAELAVEDQRGSYPGNGKRGGIRHAKNERGKNKMKWHERIKVKMYIPYAEMEFEYFLSYPPPRKVPFTKRITAYIDYFPFAPGLSRVRYKVKNIRFRTGPKYNVIMTKKQKKQDAEALSKPISKKLKQGRIDEEKDNKWATRYDKKYRPDLLPEE